jgi:hypothetical protein
MPPLLRPQKVAASEFDALAMLAAMDVQRTERGLSWRQVADQVWDQSALLNRRRADHPISPSTITGIAKRADCTCQHALFFLRWLERTPESFIAAPRPVAGDLSLPAAGSDRRPRWNLVKLYEALNSRRQDRRLTWKELARQLRCTDSQLTGIRTARFAIGMTLAMRIVQWLERSAASFIEAAQW